MVTESPRCWSFSFSFLPPGVNHQYTPIGVQGKKALTNEARALRDSITLLARRAGFEPRDGALYAVRITFTMPGWAQDIDSPLKSALDSIFGQRADHRVVLLHVEKRVERGVRQTDVTITELTV